jgi:hypothetical protein
MQCKKWLPALLLTLLMLLPIGNMAFAGVPAPSTVRIRAAATQKPTATPKPAKTPKPTRTPKPTATPQPIVRPANFPTLPPTNDKGFLKEGEFVYENADEGLWMYASTL